MGRFLILLVVLAGSDVWAVENFDPSWRGQDRTLYGQWDEWNDWADLTQPYIPPGYTRPITIPPGMILSMKPDASNPDRFVLPYGLSYSRGWPQEPQRLAAFDGRSGVMMFNDGDILSLDIPPMGPNELGGRTMRIQLTYYAPASEPTEIYYSGRWTEEFKHPNVSVTRRDERLFAPQEIELGSLAWEGGWETHCYEFTPALSPFMEFVSIRFDGGPYYLDSVVIDARMIPEPTLLVPLAALTVFRMRGRVKKGRGLTHK
jgi:hypothetical protein